MSTDVRTQLAELRHLSIAELKQRWRDLVGTDPPQYSRSFLVSRRDHPHSSTDSSTSSGC